MPLQDLSAFVEHEVLRDLADRGVIEEENRRDIQLV